MANFMNEIEQRLPTQDEVDTAVRRAKRLRAEATSEMMSGLRAMLQRAVNGAIFRGKAVEAKPASKAAAPA
jgi:hypothetical protein